MNGARYATATVALAALRESGGGGGGSALEESSWSSAMEPKTENLFIGLWRTALHWAKMRNPQPA